MGGKAAPKGSERVLSGSWARVTTAGGRARPGGVGRRDCSWVWQRLRGRSMVPGGGVQGGVGVRADGTVVLEGSCLPTL